MKEVKVVQENETLFKKQSTRLSGTEALEKQVYYWKTPLHRYRHQITAILAVLLIVTLILEGIAAFPIAASLRVVVLSMALMSVIASLFALIFLKILPSRRDGKYLQEINPGAFLEREVVSFQEKEIFAALNGQVIMVTGAAGSIGSELCRQLLGFEPEVLIALDINETGLFDLAESIRLHPNGARLRPFIGDITDTQRLSALFAGEQPKMVFHAAAYKHVPLLERFPDQAVRTNILGTYNLCRLAQEHKVERFVFISTDKAAEPVSVMGASKRVGEMMVQALEHTADHATCFCAVRFGNVIGSRGSVVPIFTQQIEQGGPVTITDPEATRYFMTIPEACGLVIFTSATAAQGGLYLLDMGKAVRIMDLALKMIHARGLAVGRDIDIVYTGLRPGERQHEMLVNEGEELIPTAHNKIFCVTCADTLPTFATVTRWVHDLEDCLQYENSERLRRLLFEIACKLGARCTVD